MVKQYWTRFLVAQIGKDPPAMQETGVLSLGQEGKSLENGMAATL